MKRKIISILVASLLFAGSSAIKAPTLKQRLAQVSQMNSGLAELDAGLDLEAYIGHDGDHGNGTIGTVAPLNITCPGCTPITCPTCTNAALNVVPCTCTLNTPAGGGLPLNLGSAALVSNQQNVVVSQGQHSVQVPNTGALTTTNSSTCACANAQEAECGSRQRYFNWCVEGGICATEIVDLREFKNAAEQTKGESHSSLTEITNHQNGGGSGTIPGNCLTVCFPVATPSGGAGAAGLVDIRGGAGDAAGAAADALAGAGAAVNAVRDAALSAGAGAKVDVDIAAHVM